MQPYIFPYVGYFQLIHDVDTFIIHDNVQYIKGGWINRNRILLDQDDHLFTFSLESDSSSKNINQRYFTDDFSDQCKTFLRVLQTAYGNAPYFDPTMKILKENLEMIDPNKRENIALKISRSLVNLSAHLGLDTNFVYASNISENKENTPQKRIINLCKRMVADKYINLPGGKALYDFAHFREHGIELSFLEPELSEYPQFSESFIPRLSIIDMLMFNDRSEIKNLLNDYTLINQSNTYTNARTR